MTAALSRKVQITTDEFLRQRPDAIEGRPFTVEDEEIVVDAIGTGRVRIVLTDKGDVKLGQLDLPMMHIDFSFESMTDEEARMFMQVYDAHKMRVGGMQAQAGFEHLKRFMTPASDRTKAGSDQRTQEAAADLQRHA